MARRLSQRVCIKPGAVKIITSRQGNRLVAERTRTKKALCGKLEEFSGNTVLVRVRGQLYAAPAKQLREYKQMWNFRP